MRFIFTLLIAIALAEPILAQPSRFSRGGPDNNVLSSGPLPDLNAFTAEGEPLKIRDLVAGYYTIGLEDENRGSRTFVINRNPRGRRL